MSGSTSSGRPNNSKSRLSSGSRDTCSMRTTDCAPRSVRSCWSRPRSVSGEALDTRFIRASKNQLCCSWKRSPNNRRSRSGTGTLNNLAHSSPRTRPLASRSKLRNATSAACSPRSSWSHLSGSTWSGSCRSSASSCNSSALRGLGIGVPGGRCRTASNRSRRCLSRDACNIMVITPLHYAARCLLSYPGPV